MVNYQSLVGRQWEYGSQDCYGLIKDYFKLLGVQLPEYERPKNLETCQSIFLDQMPKKGFKQIELNYRLPNDVLIMRLGTKTPMHGAILLPNEMILHQKLKSLSCVEPLRSYYVESVEAVFRYDATSHSSR